MPPGSNFNREDRDLLTRLEERIIYIQTQIRDLHARIDKDQENTKDDFVSKIEFIPVQRSVYAAIGMILSGAVGTIVYYLLKIH